MEFHSGSLLRGVLPSCGSLCLCGEISVRAASAAVRLRAPVLSSHARRVPPQQRTDSGEEAKHMQRSEEGTGTHR